MGKYTEQSYAPQYLNLGMSGSPGLNNEPFSLIKGDKVAENILILAYLEPISVVDLSKQLGIPTGYVEPVVDKLVNGELMQRTGAGKVYTDFIIHSEQDYRKPFKKQKELVDKHFSKIWEGMKDAIEDIRALPVYQKSSRKEKEQLELYFCLDMMVRMMIKLRDTIAGELPFSEYPYREDGGRWFGIGTAWKPNPTTDPTLEEEMQYVTSGEMKLNINHYRNTKSIQLAGYETKYGESPVGKIEGLREVALLELLFDCYDGRSSEELAHNAYYIRWLPELERMRIIKKVEDGYTLELPVITNADYWKIKDIMTTWMGKIVDQVGDDLIEVYHKGVIQLPKHLKSVPEWLRYETSGWLIPMMVIKKAIDTGELEVNVDQPVSTMVFIVD